MSPPKKEERTNKIVGAEKCAKKKNWICE